MPEPVGPGGHWNPQYLADQLTLFQPGEGRLSPIFLTFRHNSGCGHVYLVRALFTCSSVLSAWVFDGFLKFNWSFGCFGQKKGHQTVQ